MVSLVNAHTNAPRIGWHLWEIDLRFAPGLPPGWVSSAATNHVQHVLLSQAERTQAQVSQGAEVSQGAQEASSSPGLSHPPWRQPSGKWMVSLVNSHTNATSKRWHL